MEVHLCCISLRANVPCAEHCVCSVPTDEKHLPKLVSFPFTECCPKYQLFIRLLYIAAVNTWTFYHPISSPCRFSRWNHQQCSNNLSIVKTCTQFLSKHPLQQTFSDSKICNQKPEQICQNAICLYKTSIKCSKQGPKRLNPTMHTSKLTLSCTPAYNSPPNKATTPTRVFAENLFHTLQLMTAEIKHFLFNICRSDDNKSSHQ